MGKFNQRRVKVGGIWLTLALLFAVVLPAKHALLLGRRRVILPYSFIGSKYSFRPVYDAVQTWMADYKERINQ